MTVFSLIALSVPRLLVPRGMCAQVVVGWWTGRRVSDQMPVCRFRAEWPPSFLHWEFPPDLLLTCAPLFIQPRMDNIKQGLQEALYKLVALNHEALRIFSQHGHRLPRASYWGAVPACPQHRHGVQVSGFWQAMLQHRFQLQVGYAALCEQPPTITTGHESTRSAQTTVPSFVSLSHAAGAIQTNVLRQPPLVPSSTRSFTRSQRACSPHKNDPIAHRIRE